MGRHFFMGRGAAAGCLILLSLLGGCKKKESMDSTPIPQSSTRTPQPTLTWIQANIFDVGGVNPGCAASACHSGGQSPNLSSKTQSFASLVNVTSPQDTSKKYALPGDPANSYLVIKLQSGGTIGSRMPQNNPSYFDAHPDELQAIKDWITNGAANN